MAHILIATANIIQRRCFAATLRAARHHVVTTDDAVLALAVLHESAQPLIVLLGEQLDPLPPRGPFSGSSVLAHALERPRRAGVDCRHAFIMLTRQPPHALPASVRTLLATGEVTLLAPNCSIAALLEAVEDATDISEAPVMQAPARLQVVATPQPRPRTAEIHVPHQVTMLAAGLRTEVARLRETATITQVKLDIADGAIQKTEASLRNAERRLYVAIAAPAPMSPQRITLAPIVAQAHVVQRQEADSAGVC